MPTQSRRPFSRRLRAAATERLGLKGAALFFACALWLVVRAAEPDEELVPVRFAPALDSTLELQGTPPQVRALMIGRGGELIKLYSDLPVIRRAVPADVPDTLTMELRPEDVDLPPGVEAVVRDVRPRRVTLHFATRVARTLPVRSELRFVAGPGVRIVGAPQLEPDSVRVAGDRRAVGRLTDVATIAADISVNDAASVVVPLDTSDLEVRVRPARVRVRIPVVIQRAPPPADSGR